MHSAKTATSALMDLIGCAVLELYKSLRTELAQIRRDQDAIGMIHSMNDEHRTDQTIQGFVKYLRNREDGGIAYAARRRPDRIGSAPSGASYDS
jgi:hypothetical protein